MSSLHKNIPGVCFAVLLLFCTISFIQSSPASTDEVIKRFISNHIPVENQNWGISQSPVNGFIYFANSEGLIEYNGISRKTYRLPYGKTVRSVHISQDGTIFTGSFEEFGYWKVNQDGDPEYHSLSDKISIEKNDEI